jgi:tetratricopeptide (TPR) repeat protein
VLAGERALASRAYEEAELQFQRGLDASAGRPMDAEQAALLFGLGIAQTATAELPRAHEVVANLTRAIDYYASECDTDRAVAIAECPVDALPGQPVGAARLVARALTLVEPDSHAEARLLPRYARVAAIEEGNYPAAAAACERALSIARRDGDIRLEIQTLGNGAEGDMNFMRSGPLSCWSRRPVISRRRSCS